MKIGAKVNIFNYKMRERRAEIGMSQKDLADAVNVNVHYIGKIETLQIPYKDIGRIKRLLFDIADALDIDLSLIFPEDYLVALEMDLLPRCRKPTLILKDISINELPPSSEYLCLPSAEEIVMNNPPTMKEDIAEILSELPPREARILKMRYGIGGDDPLTIDEVARKYRVTRERIRQIEAQAMSRLRHPKVQRKIGEYLYR